MNPDQVKNIGIIMGGYSNEYEISIKSCEVFMKPLKTAIIATEFILKKMNGF